MGKRVSKKEEKKKQESESSSDDDSSSSEEEQPNNKAKKPPPKVGTGMQTLYLIWPRGPPDRDFDRQRAMGKKIDAILLGEFGDCQNPAHICWICNGGKPTICGSMEGCLGEWQTERFLRYSIPVGPELDRIRLSLLAVGSCYSDIRSTLGDSADICETL